MKKEELYEFVQRSCSMSTLFSICDLLRLASERLEDLGLSENIGLSNEEKKELKKLSFDVFRLKDNIAHIAVPMFDELEHKCGE